MGSSSSPEEGTNKGIDASVGSLVWVRRRNGSWWPGRILGQEELPESVLNLSPRTGTPVKLLGREDASVDWYNLEKSKRVKAFRCGEYDECIEKAKASAANASKKVVKYARREDAILHALEIENARLSKDDPEFFSGVGKSGGIQSSVKGLPKELQSDDETENMEELSSYEDNSNSALELSQSVVSFEEPNHICTSKEQSVQGRRRRTPNDSEDDGTEGIKRMRGLEDLGMGVVSSLKRKRSQVANVHEFLKRKNRRRQLTKVLESTIMVSVPVMCEQLPSPTRVSDGKASMVINNNSDSTGVSYENGPPHNASQLDSHASVVNCKQKENEISSMLEIPEDDSSERLFDVPFVGEDKDSTGFSPGFVSCAPQKPQLAAGAQSSQSSQVEAMYLGNEELHELGSMSSGAADTSTFSQRIEKGASKWQHKKKRNSRHKRKNKGHNLRKYVDVDDESNACFLGLEPRLGSSWRADCDVDEFPGWGRHISPKEPTPQRSLPFRQSRVTVNPKYPLSEYSLRDYEDDSILYDVDLEVKASYRPQHVPYISLMSKLNGQPITGHPLTVEVLEDGSCDELIGGSDFYSSSSEFGDDVLEIIHAVQGVDMDYEPNPNSGGGRFPARNLTLQHVSPSKLLKSRKNGLLLKKTRKLSSLTGSHKQSEEEKKPVVEKFKGPAVACVPLKVVFSRINAALSNSMRPAHRVITPNKQ